MEFAVCDDSAADRNTLIAMVQQYCGQRGIPAKILQFSRAGELLQEFTPGRYHVVFLDIYMPGLTGVEAARRLRKRDANCMLVFTTTSEEHALDSYSVYAAGYLLKPYSREQLAEWVAYAREQQAVLLFDAAYEAFVQEDLPRSIFEIEGAETCAVEFCSLSKTAGFTGTRCGYTVVPSALMRDGMSLRKMWLRRQTTKFNGVSYPVQRAAAAVFTEEGLRECRRSLRVYQSNARRISDTLEELDIWHVGGKNSPYIWMECPGGRSSWEFFDDLLERAQVLGTPGSGFGRNGEGFFRLTAFGTPEDTAEAMERFRAVYGR